MFCSNCGNKISSDQKFCTYCGAENSALNPISKKEQAIVDDYEYDEILAFLSNAKKLETEKYTLQQIILRIKQNISSLNYKCQVKQDEENDIGFKSLALPLYAVMFSVVIWIFRGCSSIVENGANGEFPGFWDTLKPLLAIAGALVILAMIVQKIINSKVKRQYNKKCNKEELAYQERLKKINCLNDEIKKYEKEISYIDNLRNKLYTLNVLPSKYCSLIPVVTISEYFEIGKCNSLKGPSGAYMIFDDEVRHNMIISQLNQIIDRLEVIAQNQRMLYDALQEANRISNEISYQNMKILENQIVIKDNSAATAYLAKRTEENTRISAYVDAFSNRT